MPTLPSSSWKTSAPAARSRPKWHAVCPEHPRQRRGCGQPLVLHNPVNHYDVARPSRRTLAFCAPVFQRKEPVMLLAHAVTLAEARSYIAALADEALTFDGSVEYEHALLYLDLVPGDDIPAPDTSGLTDDRAIRHALTVRAAQEQTDHGVDNPQTKRPPP